MREAEVQAAFVAHLLERGWDPTVDGLDHVDVRVRRGAERLVAEVRGDTSSPGTDVDTLVGQLLRRIDPDTDERNVLVVTQGRWAGCSGSTTGSSPGSGSRWRSWTTLVRCGGSDRADRFLRQAPRSCLAK